MSKFYNKRGKSCRYKFGDVVIFTQQDSQDEYVIIDTKWIGSCSHGFWEIYFKNIITNNTFSRLNPQGLKKVGSLLGGKR